MNICDKFMTENRHIMYPLLNMGLDISYEFAKSNLQTWYDTRNKLSQMNKLWLYPSLVYPYYFDVYDFTRKQSS